MDSSLVSCLHQGRALCVVCRGVIEISHFRIRDARGMYPPSPILCPTCAQLYAGALAAYRAALESGRE